LPSRWGTDAAGRATGAAIIAPRLLPLFLPTTMTSPIQLLDVTAARTHGYQPASDYKFAQKLSAVGVQLAELSALVPLLPLAIAKLAQDRFALVALTGFADGRNLVVDDQGRWLISHVPLDLRAYPFSLQAMKPQQEGSVSFGVGFNHASGLYRQAPDASRGELRFFDDAGQPQPGLKQLCDQMQQNAAQQALTGRAVQAIVDAELLVPWQIAPRPHQPAEVLPQGLYRVDEKKLIALDAAALERLHRVHAMALAYGLLLSMSRVMVLQRLSQRLQQRPAAAAPVAGPVDPALVQELFGKHGTDTLHFNF